MGGDTWVQDWCPPTIDGTGGLNMSESARDLRRQGSQQDTHTLLFAPFRFLLSAVVGLQFGCRLEEGRKEGRKEVPLSHPRLLDGLKTIPGWGTGEQLLLEVRCNQSPTTCIAVAARARSGALVVGWVSLHPCGGSSRVQGLKERRERSNPRPPSIF